MWQTHAPTFNKFEVWEDFLGTTGQYLHVFKSDLLPLDIFPIFTIKMGIYSINSSKMIGILQVSMNFTTNLFLSQTQLVQL
jgi:hypothetical protein